MMRVDILAATSRVRRRLSFIPLLVVAVASVAGCAGPYTVLVQARPSPYSTATEFNVEPLSFDSAVVGRKTEAAWLATRSTRQQESWEVDKIEMRHRFEGRLIAHSGTMRITNGSVSGPDVISIRSVVVRAEPGLFASGLVARDAVVRLQVQLVHPSGVVLDVFEIESRVRASMFRASIGGRMRLASEHLAELTLQYLLTRAHAG